MFKNILKHSSIVVIVIVALVTGVLVGCQKEETIEDIIENTDNSSLEIVDFRNWFHSQEIVSEFIGKQEPDWSKAELKILPDSYNSLQVSIEIYKGKNSLGNDSIRELQIAYVKNSFTGGVKVLSCYDQENAYAKYYSLGGQILEEGVYYAPKQQYILLKRYTIEGSHIRLKSGSESNDPCNGTQVYTNSATPYANNSDAYNCHAYVWGYLSPNDPCYLSDHPYWNNCPDIAGSGYSQVSTPHVGDRWVSYGSVSGWGYVPVHSAIVKEVVNGHVTKVEAKCGEQGIYIYNPDCNAPLFASYKTNDIKYYRK
jgi:hypothetical protein